MNTVRFSACTTIRPLLGVAVLGLAEPAEARAVQAHLASCSACALIEAELSPLPSLLGGIEPSDVADDLPPLPPSLVRRTLDQVSEAASAAESSESNRRVRRLRRRNGMTLAAGAAAAVLVLLVPWNDTPRPTGAPTSVVAAVSDTQTHVRGRFVLSGTDTGSRVQVSLAGVRPGQRCRLITLATGGRREVAASWVVRYDGTAVVTGHTGLAPGDVTGLRVVTHTGQVLVRADATDLHAGN